jgi:hypothetical protein
MPSYSANGIGSHRAGFSIPNFKRIPSYESCGCRAVQKTPVFGEDDRANYAGETAGADVLRTSFVFKQ